MPKPKSPFKRAMRAFSPADLKRICEMHESEFADYYDMDTYVVQNQDPPDNEYYFKDNGSNILAVAHLDTVMPHHRRMCNFINTAAGTVIYSGALDDRLGAYTLLELMPRVLDVKFDWLLTVGEEKGNSTAQYFDPPEGKEYNWMIEFDRGGTDVVMYQYDDVATDRLVRESGARTQHGIFSDISYMEHLEIKGFNWGVGYRDYHGPRSHAFLEDYLQMMGYFVKFHEANKDIALPHSKKTWSSYSHFGRGRGSNYSYGGQSSTGSYYGGWTDDDWAEWEASTRPDDEAQGEEVLEYDPADLPDDADMVLDEQVPAELEEDPDFIEYPTNEQMTKALSVIEGPDPQFSHKPPPQGELNRQQVDKYLRSVN